MPGASIDLKLNQGISFQTNTAPKATSVEWRRRCFGNNSSVVGESFLGWQSIGAKAKGATHADELAAHECGFAFLVGPKWTEVIAGSGCVIAR
ncbi:MAG: hypothetical protein QOJ42_1724 [Acidobacteriaceae bacterium]|nr:hypothetical protein [Acidobacteriaceae bacterium]